MLFTYHVPFKEVPTVSLVELIVTLVIVGVVLYLVNRYVPLDPKIKTILNWAVVIVVCLWLLRAFGLFGHINNVRVGKPG